MTLVATHLTYGYRPGTPAIRDLSIDLPAGSLTAIIGPNGVGKSTLLRVLAGVRQPWIGEISLQGSAIHRLAPSQRAERIALVSQRPTIAGAYTARQVIQFGRYAQRQEQSIIDASLSAMELDHLAEAPVHELSIGQQQRVAIARALAQLGFQMNAPAQGAMQGKVFLADEPIAAMDPHYAAITMRLLRAMSHRGAAVVVVLHDLTMALNWTDRCALLSPAGVVAVGPTSSTLSPDRLETVFGASFQLLGEPGRGAITISQDAV